MSMNDKVTELLEAKAAYVAWTEAKDMPEVKRLLSAIEAFEPPEPKRAEFWGNIYRSGGMIGYSSQQQASEITDVDAVVRKAVHFREVLPGDENLVIVKPADEWTAKDLEYLFIVGRGPLTGEEWMRAAINTIREMGKP